MCGRYSLFTPPNRLSERFDVAVGDDYDPTYNAAPGQDLPVISDDAPDELDSLTWGLVPGWVEDPDDAPRPINARAETADEKPMFREAYRRRRCLVPADGFYEWPDDGRPRRIHLDDDEPFAMAGLWETWEGEPAQTSLGDFGDSDRTRRIDSFAILTTEPNDLVSEFHDRMAVVLPPGREAEWLTAGDPADLLTSYPADGMRVDAVSRAVNDPGTDRPGLVEPVE